jgi:hypothetical protein
MTFRNDTGAPRKFHSEACRRISENVRIAERRARSAGQTNSGRTRAAQVRRLRGGLTIATEQASVRQDAIAAMCQECEPEGLCRTADCPLRQFSPLPMAVRAVIAPRTLATIRATTEQRRPEDVALAYIAMYAGRTDAYSPVDGRAASGSPGARS